MRRTYCFFGRDAGTSNLKAHEGLSEAICRANKQGRRLAAICAAPSILGEMDLLKGRLPPVIPALKTCFTGLPIRCRA